jgi:hypothetical protein
MTGGYTYTTIRGGPEEAMRIEVSFHLDDAAWIRACGQDGDRPSLAIRHGDVGVDFAPTPGRITEDDVRVARQLADQAAAYAAGVERFKADQDARAENTAA